QMLAALMNWPQATFASKIDIKNSSAQVIREIDGGLETIEVQLPAVISTDLRLNEPRYASLPNIMKAKRKPLDIIEIDTLNLNLKQHIEVLKVSAPAARSVGIKVESVDELLDKLQHEAKVL
ncbi:MAG: electron transfer flavoprotein subunit beta/FixA family protein, partial [Gammaproteobacteria bacterium]|nr:electron transfer flavoprotein subunit beta/FixA family protein [Gammaproteobacteria bacterium]